MKKFILVDLVVFNAVFLFSYWLRIHSGLFSFSDVSLHAYIPLLTFSSFTLLVVFFSFSLYREKKGGFTTEEFFLLFKALALTFILIMATTFLYKTTIYSRLILAFTFFLSLIFLPLARSLFSVVFSRFVPKESVVIYRDDALGRRLLQKIQEHPELGYRFLGFLDNFASLTASKIRPDVVFITFKPSNKELSALIMQHQHISFKIVPDLLELITGPLDFSEFQDIPLITLPKESSTFHYLRLKRVFDVCVSLLLLLVLSPFFLVLVVLIKLTSRGPVLHKQIRIGKDERPFVFYKFRTMCDGAPQSNLANEVGYLFKKKHDPRVTFLGKLLRRTCLDELPQLWNVLKGDMSLVGPRPHFAEELRVLRGWQRDRFRVRPGMTGMWQISGRHELSFEKTVFLDIYYIHHMSFFLDLKILFQTIPAILFSGGRW